MSLIDQSWYLKPSGLCDRIASGGVVVRTEGDRILVALVREGQWPDYVLPKGGVEAGEDLIAAARREVHEEAGLSQLSLIQKLGTLERLTFTKDRWSIAHFFLFQTDQIEGTPTDTEHNYGVWWFPIDDLPAFFWPEQRELIDRNRPLITTVIGPIS
jgi:ADP-ribose pyrophosphatase YjhB (NUDIX family)